MNLKIVKDSNPKLREKCALVPTPLSPEHQELIDAMLAYLIDSQNPDYRAKHPAIREGIGLAAPQVGNRAQ